MHHIRDIQQALFYVWSIYRFWEGSVRNSIRCLKGSGNDRRQIIFRSVSFNETQLQKLNSCSFTRTPLALNARVRRAYNGWHTCKQWVTQHPSHMNTCEGTWVTHEWTHVKARVKHMKRGRQTYVNTWAHVSSNADSSTPNYLKTLIMCAIKFWTRLNSGLNSCRKPYHKSWTRDL